MSSNPQSTHYSIPSHPAPPVPSTDATFKKSDTAAARHAIEHTDSWKPHVDRRQSWSKEDQKRSLQMTGMADGNGVGAGFSERG